MNLKAFHIRNFRRLKDVVVQLDTSTSIFVGANNSGKTSATHVFQLFLGESSDKFAIYDFSVDCWKEFDVIDTVKTSTAPTLTPLFPSVVLDLWFEVQDADLHRVIDLLPSLDWKNTLLGLRIEYAAKDAAKLLANYTDAKNKGVKAASSAKAGGSDYQPWPKSITDYLTKRLGSEFEKRYFVLDRAQFDENLNQKSTYVPMELGDSERSGVAIVKSLLRVDFLNAQRHISDVTSPGRSEDLSKRLSKFYERNLQQRSEDESFEAIRVLANSEEQLNAHLAKVFTPTLAKLNNLGYPGFFDPHLVIKSALNPESIMKQNAQVHYALGAPGKSAQDIILPDKYNGLGFKNLIYMVIEVLDFHARWTEEKEDRPPLHIVMIEEPEAHLHAQLQQVFIRKILEILPKEDAALFTTQLVITTHSPHIIYESGFMPIRYFRRSSTPEAIQCSEVLNLSDFYGKTKKETSEFLQRYMKLTHCDLFFADASILVEGNVERLLLPIMIEKSAPKLQFNYLSILEVGGAFAHCFKELIEFLGQITLVITDLDSVTKKEAAEPVVVAAQSGADDESEPSSGGVACKADTGSAVTSNATLKEWLPRLSSISELLAATPDVKEQKPTASSPAHIRVAYQTLREAKWKGEQQAIAGRTLEEAFALENLEWCQLKEQKALHLRVEPKTACSLSDMAGRIFERVNSTSFKKTEFALGLMSKNPADWRVPTYIEDGLCWLSTKLESPPTTDPVGSPGATPPAP